LGKRSPAYDGWKRLYTAGPLPFMSMDFVIKLIDNNVRASSSGSVRYFPLLECTSSVCSSLSHLNLSSIFFSFYLNAFSPPNVQKRT
jgi:hypothetical protein